MDVYITVFFRIITIMSLLLFSTLFIMGKRPIGELPVFDFLAIIVIGAIVGADIADPKIEHLPTAFAVVILALFQRVVSGIIIRNKKMKKLLTFEPTIIIRNGKFLYKNIKKTHYALDDILMLLREKEIFDISKVDYGIIEANGNMSILKKPQYEAVTMKDMNMPYPPSNFSMTVIFDGELQEKNITLLNTTVEDIAKKLKEQGYDDYHDIFYASMDLQGNLTVSSYNK